MNEAELSQVLQIINAVRAQCGLPMLSEIPQGTAPEAAVELSRACPLARAWPTAVIGADYVRTTDGQFAETLRQSFGKPLYGMIEFPGEFAIDLPAALIAFITQYDEGHLPQFIEAV